MLQPVNYATSNYIYILDGNGKVIGKKEPPKIKIEQRENLTVGNTQGNSSIPMANLFIYRDPMGMESAAVRRERMSDMPVTRSFLDDLNKVLKGMRFTGLYVDNDIFGVIGQIMSNVT